MIRFLFAMAVLISLGLVSWTWAQTAPSTQPATAAVDVTAKVKDLVKENKLSITPDPDELGADPAVGTDKRLKVEYTVGGKAHTVTAEQGHSLNLPSDADGDGTLAVTKATWGLPATIGTVTADVTEKVKEGVKNNALTISASNDAMACDPGVGLLKELKVDYSVDGKAHSAKANEGDDLTIPAAADGAGSLVIVKATWEPSPDQAQ